MSFIGQAEVTIDKKSRLAVPAKFRSVLEGKKLGPGWVCMPRGELLWLVPEVEFDRLSAGWGDSLIPDEDTEDLQRSLFGLSERVEMDAAGRVTLPRKHLDYTGLDGEAVVIGIPHDRLGEVPKAYVVAEGEAEISPKDVFHISRTQTASYKAIEEAEIVTADFFPRTALGKVMKSEMKKK